MSQKNNLLVHIDALYRSALYLVKNENNADDLVQETYLKAFKFIESGKEIYNEKAWLFKILINTFINQYRKGKKEPRLVDFDSKVPLVFCMHDDTPIVLLIACNSDIDFAKMKEVVADKLVVYADTAACGHCQIIGWKEADTQYVMVSKLSSEKLIGLLTKV